jgi:hypothetical protein
MIASQPYDTLVSGDMSLEIKPTLIGVTAQSPTSVRPRNGQTVFAS